MDALANLGIDGKLFLAQIVNFLVLLFILKRYAYQPMLAFLEKRTERIEQGLKDATAAQAKLESIIEEETTTMASARKEAQGIIREAEVAAKKRDALHLEATEKEAKRFLDEAEVRLAEEKEKMVAAAKKEIAETVTLALEKMLRENVDGAKDRELIHQRMTR